MHNICIDMGDPLPSEGIIKDNIDIDGDEYEAENEGREDTAGA